MLQKERGEPSIGKQRDLEKTESGDRRDPGCGHRGGCSADFRRAESQAQSCTDAQIGGDARHALRCGDEERDGGRPPRGATQPIEESRL